MIEQENTEGIGHEAEECTDRCEGHRKGQTVLPGSDEIIWREFIGRDVIPENNAGELYFEERDIEAFAERLEKLYPDIKYVNRLMTHSWGQKVIRFYDLDGNLIEVGTPM